MAFSITAGAVISKQPAYLFHLAARCLPFSSVSTKRVYDHFSKESFRDFVDAWWEAWIELDESQCIFLLGKSFENYTPLTENFPERHAPYNPITKHSHCRQPEITSATREELGPAE
jgi:hypothetical protein